jgi:hypothetical protein
MALEFFVNPKHTETLYPWKHMAGGENEWIKVKKFLSVREAQEVQTAGLDHIRTARAKDEKPDGDGVVQENEEPSEVKMGVDVGRMKLIRALKYIVGWSLTMDGAAVPINEETVGNLHEEIFKSIDEALDAHKKRVDKEKKDQSGLVTLTSASA